MELGREFTFSYHGATLRTGPGRGQAAAAGGGKLCVYVDMMLISKFLEGGEAVTVHWTWGGLQFVLAS